MDLHLLSHIDYGLYSDTERAQLVTRLLDNEEILTLIEENYTNSSVQAQLEGLANYILYGKNNTTKTNQIQDKKITIHTKYSSYARKTDESLDELLANPLFDEGTVKDLYTRNSYTKPKNPIARPTYDRLGNELSPGDGDLPTMRQLWHSIDLMARKVALALGREEPDEGEEPPKWSSLQLYKMRHWLIDLRKHQYYIRDAYTQVIPPHHSFAERSYIDWCQNSGYWVAVPAAPVQLPRRMVPPQSTSVGSSRQKIIPEESLPQWEDGEYRYNPATGQLEQYHLVRKHILDFKNPHHVYCLLMEYDRLWKESYEDTVGQMKFILDSFDEIGRTTQFTPVQEVILDLKVARWTNERIQVYIQEKFGYKYNVNYISTLFKKGICEKIAATAAQLEKEHLSQHNAAEWKICSTCGRTLLRDKTNFVRKASSRDGLAARCKRCDKDIREGRPIGYGTDEKM